MQPCCPGNPGPVHRTRQCSNLPATMYSPQSPGVRPHAARRLTSRDRWRARCWGPSRPWTQTRRSPRPGRPCKKQPTASAAVRVCEWRAAEQRRTTRLSHAPWQGPLHSPVPSSRGSACMRPAPGRAAAPPGPVLPSLREKSFSPAQQATPHLGLGGAGAHRRPRPAGPHQGSQSETAAGHGAMVYCLSTVDRPFNGSRGPDGHRRGWLSTIAVTMPPWDKQAGVEAPSPRTATPPAVCRRPRRDKSQRQSPGTWFLGGQFTFYSRMAHSADASREQRPGLGSQCPPCKRARELPQLTSLGR